MIIDKRMAEHNKLGKKGEALARNFLEKKSYRIIETNWRVHKYEIDIIALDNEELVFVEVKTRRTDFFGTPEEAVSLSKQNHLINGADHYIERNDLDMECRFDVIAIVVDETVKRINHIENAFYPEA